MADLTFHEVKLPLCTLSFPKLHKSESFEGGAPKFGATLLIDKDADMTALNAALSAAMREVHPGKKYNDFHPNNKCFGDGDEKAYDGYAGRMFLRGKSKDRIPCVDLRKRALIDTSDEGQAAELYAGCRVAAKVSIYGYAGKGSGIGCIINSIAKAAEGDRLDGGGRDPMADYAEDFDAYADASAGDVATSTGENIIDF